MTLRKLISFFLGAFFMVLSLSAGASELREHHRHETAQSGSISQFEVAQPPGSDCDDPCHLGFCHFGHCSIAPAPYQTLTLALFESALLPGPSSLHEAPFLEGLRRPPRFA